jgi:hypothetical protein
MKLEAAPQDVIIAGEFEQRDVAIVLRSFSTSYQIRFILIKNWQSSENCRVTLTIVTLWLELSVPFDVHLPTQLEP